MSNNETIINVPEWEYLDRLSTAYAIGVSKHIYETEHRELNEVALKILNRKAMAYAVADLDLSRRMDAKRAEYDRLLSEGKGPDEIYEIMNKAKPN